MKQIFKKAAYRLMSEKSRRRGDYKRAKKKMGTYPGQDIFANSLAYADKYAGRRCFIIGGGPSLKVEDLSRLRDEVVFTVNNVYLRDDFHAMGSNFHVVADPKFAGSVKAMTENLDKETVVFAEAALLSAFENSGFPRERLCGFYNGMEIEAIKYNRLSMDGPMPYLCTVVQNAVLLAACMGFEQIYLLGCDCTGIMNNVEVRQGKQISHYGYKIPDSIHKKIETAERISCEHVFYEWYHIFKSYRLIGEYLADVGGAQITDLSQGGILDVFPKDTLNNILGGNDNGTEQS